MKVDAAQNIVNFAKPNDENVMQYSDLKVFDADQQPLAARIVQTDPGRFSIVVDDKGAKYPVYIDPTFSNDGSVYATGGELFGYSVAYIRYLQNNYDTVSDPPGPHSDAGGPDIGGLLVGAPNFDSGSDDDAGKVFFYNANDTNLPSSPTWTYAGTQTDELLGWSVADGGANVVFAGSGVYHNILVGAPGYSTMSFRYGAALAFYPNQTTGAYGTSPSWLVTGGSIGVSAGADFGWSVAGNVDFNSDGFGDVVVGAPDADVADVRFPGSGSVSPDLSLSFSGDGAVAIFEGNSDGDGYNTTPSWTEFGGSDSGFGYSVEWGLVEGGSYAALIVGAPGVSSSKGAVYEFLNDAGTVDTSPDLTLSGASSGDLFGYALASRADQNDDGYQDLLVGAPNATFDSLAGAGKAYLYQGSSSGLSSTAAWSAGGNGTNGYLGSSLALGDMNADGLADVMIGEPNISYAYEGNPCTQNGFVNFYVTSATTYLPVYTVTLEGEESHLMLGTSLSFGNPLVNSDADMIVGVPGGSSASSQPSVSVLKWVP